MKNEDKYKNKMNNPLKSQIAANREMFNKRFSIPFLLGTIAYEAQLALIEDMNVAIESFETSLLQTAIDAVEGMKICPEGVKDKQIVIERYSSYNQALSKVVELLKGGIEGN